MTIVVLNYATAEVDFIYNVPDKLDSEQIERLLWLNYNLDEINWMSKEDVFIPSRRVEYEQLKKDEEPEVIEADTAGYMVKFPDAGEVFYIGTSCPPIVNGVCYKSREAFDDQQGICYTPESDFKDISAWRDLEYDSELQERLANYLGTHDMDSGHVALDVGYTWGGLRDRVYLWIGDKLNDVCDDKYFELFVDYIQERMFEELDWQAPDTWLYELDVMEQYDNAPQLCSDDPRLTDKQKNELGYE